MHIAELVGFTRKMTMHLISEHLLHKTKMQLNLNSGPSHYFGFYGI